MKDINTDDLKPHLREMYRIGKGEGDIEGYAKDMARKMRALDPKSDPPREFSGPYGKSVTGRGIYYEPRLRGSIESTVSAHRVCATIKARLCSDGKWRNPETGRVVRMPNKLRQDYLRQKRIHNEAVRRWTPCSCRACLSAGRRIYASESAVPVRPSQGTIRIPDPLGRTIVCRTPEQARIEAERQGCYIEKGPGAR